MAGVTQTDADQDVQAVADRVSQIHCRARHQTIENMGLGLYGGAHYDMVYRNRDGWEGPGSLGNQEARLYIQNAFKALGLSVSVQGSYLNVVGELTGTTSPENIYIIGGHYDHLEGDLPGGDDNASGTAGVMEAARVLSQYRFESTSDSDAFINNGYPAFLVIENSLPDFWDANKYYHGFYDASDRLANDPDSPSGVTYDFAFATDVTRVVVALVAQKAILVH